jgi:hypothetical protein
VNAIKLPKIGAVTRVPTPRGEAFGVVVEAADSRLGIGYNPRKIRTGTLRASVV